MRSLFPNIDQPEVLIKLRKSLMRSLGIIGVVPLLWGVVKIYEGVITEGVISIVTALIWATALFLLKSKIRLISLLTIILITIIFFNTVITVKYTLNAVDWIIVLSVCLLTLYGVGFLYETDKQTAKNQDHHMG